MRQTPCGMVLDFEIAQCVLIMKVQSAIDPIGHQEMNRVPSASRRDRTMLPDETARFASGCHHTMGEPQETRQLQERGRAHERAPTDSSCENRIKRRKMLPLRGWKRCLMRDREAIRTIAPLDLARTGALQHGGSIPIARRTDRCFQHPRHRPHANACLWQECDHDSRSVGIPERKTSSSVVSSTAGAVTLTPPS